LSCVVCEETQAAAQMMVQTASALRAGNELPAAGLVWRRAETLRKEVALNHATRPLVVVRAVSVIWAVLSAAWTLRYFWRSGSMELMSGWNVLHDDTVGFAAAIAVLVIAMGAWYLLYDARRSGLSVPST
jgi:hypothetical protein